MEKTMNKTQLIDAIQKELGPDATKKCAADALNATVVGVIGRKIILYRRSLNGKRHIEL